MSQLAYGEVLNFTTRKYPNKEAFICQNKRYTYKEFTERCNRLANGLLGLGIRKDDKIATLFISKMELVESYYGISKTGGVVVPLNFRCAGGELIHMIKSADVTALIYEEMFQKLIDSIRSSLPDVKSFICVGNPAGFALNYEKLVEKSSSKEPDVNVNDYDPAFIIYTAGTTGTPKGAVRTHQNEYIGALNFIFAMGDELGPETKTLSCPPAFHCATQMVLHSVMLAGGTNYLYSLYEGFNPKGVLDLVEKEKITILWMVPTMWIETLNVLSKSEKKYDLSSVRITANGGAIMPLDLKQKILKYFPNTGLMDFFGMTEMNPWTCVLTGKEALSKPESVGRPCVTVDARIWDLNGNDVPVGEVGEIVYSGPSVMQEYYKNPEATKEAMRGGYFHSGDLVKQDEEGFIYVVGRSKDMVISGGENIYPAEVEAVLIKHPKIQEAAVIGVPDPKWGESLKAVIVLHPGEQISENEVIEYCKQNIARYKSPRSVDFVSELPKSGVGKVLKTVLREQYAKK